MSPVPHTFGSGTGPFLCARGTIRKFRRVGLVVFVFIVGQIVKLLSVDFGLSQSGHEEAVDLVRRHAGDGVEVDRGTDSGQVAVAGVGHGQGQTLGLGLFGGDQAGKKTGVAVVDDPLGAGAVGGLTDNPAGAVQQNLRGVLRIGPNPCGSSRDVGAVGAGIDQGQHSVQIGAGRRKAGAVKQAAGIAAAAEPGGVKNRGEEGGVGDRVGH